LNKAHLTCARCGAIFDALSVDGEVQTTLLQERPEAVVETAGSPAADGDCAMLEAEDVLMLPNLTERTPQPNEAAAVLELAEAPAAASPFEADKTQHELHVVAEVSRQPNKASEPPVQATDDDMAASGSFEYPPEYAPQLNRADLARPAGHDKYSLGVRLMRVSPVWLLACGLAFIALVVLLNGLTGSAEQLHNAPARAAQASAVGNQASNQNARPSNRNPGAASAPAQIAKTEQSAPGKQAQAGAQSAPAAQQTQPAAAQTAAAQQAAAAPSQTEPARQPAAEVKTAAPAQQPEGSGNLTLQVGSYNNPVEANGQVERLKAAGFAARVAAAELPKRGTWYRVQTGRFADRAEAARYGAQLKTKGAASDFIVVEVEAR
jgi:cell division septation protein DedD